MQTFRLLIAAIAFVPAAPALAQDTARGARLYTDTANVTGQPVASCVACHSDRANLREMILNHRGNPDDARALARWLDTLITGARPGAANAKAQFRGVLTATDLRDLATYIARAKQASLQPELAGAAPPR